MDKELLEQITVLNKELQDLNKREKRAEKQETTVIKDSVKASSKEYPYTQYNYVVEGVQYPKSKHSRYIYKKQIKNKKRKLEKLINKLEYELNYIEDKDSEIRQIIRYRYEDNKSWIQIMFLMDYDSENTARMKLERFLKKN